MITLFGEEDDFIEDAKDAVVDFKFKVGDFYGNTQLKIIEVYSSCPVCKNSSKLKAHPQIKTNQQMIDSGWKEISPCVWQVPPHPCSRKCETKSNKI